MPGGAAGALAGRGPDPRGEGCARAQTEGGARPPAPRAPAGDTRQLPAFPVTEENRLRRAVARGRGSTACGLRGRRRHCLLSFPLGRTPPQRRGVDGQAPSRGGGGVRRTVWCQRLEVNGRKGPIPLKTVVGTRRQSCVRPPARHAEPSRFERVINREDKKSASLGAHHELTGGKKKMHLCGLCHRGDTMSRWARLGSGWGDTMSRRARLGSG